MQTTANSALSLVQGPTTIPLWTGTISSLIREQASKHGDRTAVISSWQKRRLTYKEIDARSEVVASALLSLGLRPGDAIAIMAGNRLEYLEVFLGAGRIGCPLVVLNNTYTPGELLRALARTCKTTESATLVHRSVSNTLQQRSWSSLLGKLAARTCLSTSSLYSARQEGKVYQHFGTWYFGKRIAGTLVYLFSRMNNF